jgi:hypothetical protein
MFDPISLDMSSSNNKKIRKLVVESMDYITSKVRL